ncbi:MAG: type restriction-modification system methyltransferase subunit-like protein [Clostridiaceae bacterium]|jgi:hypothetical protein|nr:type restriction-modification system methyltransferase subunit-like protein [Clostridiaceae bacterium]
MKIENDILGILDNCEIEGNVLYLPNITLDRNIYQKVNKVIENIGGKWNRKVKGHVFKECPMNIINSIMLTGEVTDLVKEFQYFPTPKSIALKIIDMAEIKSSDKLLEPSAGEGAILDLLPKENECIVIELNCRNAKVLKDKGYNVQNKDFLEIDNIKVDKIIMNPPFHNQQDIEHITHAFNMLNKGGILISIVSESPFFGKNKKSLEFRDFLSLNNAEIFDLPVGAFKESGTLVKTRIIKIKKMS